MSSLRYFTLLIFLTALGIPVGCSSTTHRPSSQNADSIQLTATMPSHYDVALTWQDKSRLAAGHIVEFATEPNGQFTTLGFWPSDQNTFTHPRLIPDTTFYYRVRPYFGPATAPAEVSLPADLSDADYVARYSKPEDYSWGAPETNPTRSTSTNKSIHSQKTVTTAAPSNLKAVIAPETVSGVHLTWIDHDNDAEGYLIEMKADHDSDYKVCAIVAPTINSFGWSLAPPQRKASFRVRAYYYGQPSNLVFKKTGPEAEANYAMPSKK